MHPLFHHVKNNAKAWKDFICFAHQCNMIYVWLLNIPHNSNKELQEKKHRPNTRQTKSVKEINQTYIYISFKGVLGWGCFLGEKSKGNFRECDGSMEVQHQVQHQAKELKEPITSDL